MMAPSVHKACTATWCRNAAPLTKVLQPIQVAEAGWEAGKGEAAPAQVKGSDTPPTRYITQQMGVTTVVGGWGPSCHKCAAQHRGWARFTDGLILGAGPRCCCPRADHTVIPCQYGLLKVL
jgi:hypothetical protein